MKSKNYINHFSSKLKLPIIQNISFILQITIILIFSSCTYSEKPKIFSKNNVTIEYPSYLSISENIYPEKNALLQVKNDYRDVYFILIDHGKKPGENGFEIMYDSITNQLKQNLKEPNVEKEDTIFTTVNNLKVKELQISGRLTSEQQNHRFLFVIDVFETPDGHIYQTAGWLLRHKRQLWTNDLLTSARSLKVK